MKGLLQYKNKPNITLKQRNGFTSPRICGYVLEEKRKKKRPVVEAECICGKTTRMRLNNYRSGNIKSCGCRQGRKNLKIDYVYPEYLPYTSEINSKYNDYLKRSKSRNIYFNLTLEEFKNLYTNNCSYCKIEGYPGIDRIDSSKGYIKGNVRSCCKYCNRAKHQETEQEFLVWLENVRCSQQ